MALALLRVFSPENFLMTSMRALVLAPVTAARRRVHRTPRPAVLALALLLGWALIPTPVRSAAREVFVSPTGSPAGDGSPAAPLDLATALSASSPANVPGSTIWLRGGTYLGGAPGTNAVGFFARLQGTADAPIIIRNYQGEHAQIDHRAGVDMAPALDLQSAAYVWIWGLDIMSGGTIRQAPAAGTELLDRGMGIRNSWGGGHNKIINAVIRNHGVGIGHWGSYTSAPHLEISGNLVYHNMFENSGISPHVGSGHGMYLLSKQTGRTRVAGNIVHTNGATGIRVGDVGVFAPLVEDNIVFGQGVFNEYGGNRDLYIMGENSAGGTYTPMRDAVVRRNSTYHLSNPGAYSESLHLGLWHATGATATVHDNYLVGSTTGTDVDALRLGYTGLVDVTAATGNTIIGATTAATRGEVPPWENTYLTTPPAQNRTLVVPNEYEPGRAHVAIYNWQQLAAVTVSLVDAGLTAGQAYEVRDAMHFYGPPVASGTYSSATPRVTIPMTGLTREVMPGEATFSPQYRARLRHTAPEFGAFIVLPRGPAAPTAPLVPAAPLAPALACDQVPSGAFFGCYFDQPDFTALTATRLDAAVDFAWGAGAPAPGLDADTFSVRWQGRFPFAAGTQAFTVTADDGVRLFVDDVLVLDQWRDQAATTTTVHVPLSAGVHTVRLDYYDNGYDAVATLTWATLNTAPTVRVTAPTAGTTVPAPAAVTLTADASDADGTISLVEFFQGATKLGEDRTAPYSVSWTNVAAGPYSLTARATDNAGGVTTSAAASLTVTAPPPPAELCGDGRDNNGDGRIDEGCAVADRTAPTVAVPSVTGTLTGGDKYCGPMTFQTTATDDRGVAAVQFLWNGLPLGSPDTTAPYALALHTATTPALADSGYLSARATDAAGNTRTSARVFVKINNRACR